MRSRQEEEEVHADCSTELLETRLAAPAVRQRPLAAHRPPSLRCQMALQTHPLVVPRCVLSAGWETQRWYHGHGHCHRHRRLDSKSRSMHQQALQWLATARHLSASGMPTTILGNAARIRLCGTNTEHEAVTASRQRHGSEQAHAARTHARTHLSSACTPVRGTFLSSRYKENNRRMARRTFGSALPWQTTVTKTESADARTASLPALGGS
jgi:hypothetical protein